MTVTEQSVFFMRLLIGADIHVLHSLTCVVDKGDWRKLISQKLLSTQYFSTMPEEIQPLLMSQSKDRPEINGIIILLLIFGDLLTIMLFTVVHKLAVAVFLYTAFNDEHLCAIWPRKQKVTVRRTTADDILRKLEWSANAFLQMKIQKK